VSCRVVRVVSCRVVSCRVVSDSLCAVSRSGTSARQGEGDGAVVGQDPGDGASEGQEGDHRRHQLLPAVLRHWRRRLGRQRARYAHNCSPPAGNQSFVLISCSFRIVCVVSCCAGWMGREDNSSAQAWMQQFMDRLTVRFVTLAIKQANNTQECCCNIPLACQPPPKTQQNKSKNVST
jgi:hypothetical protein